MGISLLLSLVVFLTLVVKKFLPPSSLAFPLIAKYLVFVFLMNLASIATTVYISNVNHLETTDMTKTLKWMFLVTLPRILFMDRPRQYRYFSTGEQRNRYYTKMVSKNVYRTRFYHCVLKYYIPNYVLLKNNLTIFLFHRT